MGGAFLMGCLYHDYRFQTEEYNNTWRCITTYTFENMELYFRKQFSMNRLLSHFTKAFHIAPITLKDSQKNEHYEKKMLAIYLLGKYSKESSQTIAEEFYISIETVELIFTNSAYKTNFQDKIKLFFKQFEADYLADRKSSLAFQDEILVSHMSRSVSNIHNTMIKKERNF